MKTIELKTAKQIELESLKHLSTERLIIWIVGKAKEKNLKLAAEDIIIECWLINPEKHSLRGYNQFPDSNSVMKRIGEMKGKKGLLAGSEMSGYYLTEISQMIFADLKELVNQKKIKEITSHNKADRTISSINEAPYKRLIRTPAYLKFKSGKLNEIVETDFLYFYGINWHSKISLVQNRIKNIDAVVKTFSERDNVLKQVHELLNTDYDYVKQKLLNLN
jgi:hypothetical protein